MSSDRKDCAEQNQAHKSAGDTQQRSAGRRSTPHQPKTKQEDARIVGTKDDDGRWHGQFTMWWVHDPDVVYCNGTYDHGKETGGWNFYAPDGRLWHYRNYDKLDELITFYKWGSDKIEIDEIRLPLPRAANK